MSGGQDEIGRIRKILERVIEQSFEQITIPASWLVLSYPDHYKFRQIEMFSSISTNPKKEQILSTFLSENSVIRLIITTTSFGLGIDCADIAMVIHWGVSSTLEEYVQETGRGGRNGSQSVFRGKTGNI